MKKIKIILVAFLVTLSLPVYAQDSFLSFKRSAETDVNISNISVEGAQRVDPSTVISYMKLNPGDAYSQSDLTEALKNLYATGLFADVNIRQDGRNLIVSVVENPVINRVAFEGNDEIEDTELSVEIISRPRAVYVRNDVRSDVDRIQELYRRSGNYSAEVKPEVIKLDQNRIDLVFNIVEGTKSTIKGVKFIGNEVFDSAELRSVVSSKEDRWYRFLSSDDRYDADRISFDSELLRRFYLKNGYVDFNIISVNSELSQDKESFFITFTIDEGERYKVNSVSVDASQLRNVDNRALEQNITFESGEWYSSDNIEESTDAITKSLGDMQYAFARVRPDVIPNESDKTVDVKFVAEETQKVFVESIDIKGNVRTLDKVIRREFETVEGDPFSASTIAKAEKGLQSLDFFNKVTVKPIPGSAPDQTVVEVEVEEKSTGEVSVGAGFSTNDGPLADFRIRERNFLGRGQDVLLATTIAGERSEYDLSFTEPYFFNRDLSAGVDLFHTTRDLQDESSYDQTTTGGALRMSYPLTKKLRQQIKYRIQNNEIDEVGVDASRFIRDQEGKRSTSAIGQTLTYDNLDSTIKPTDGYKAWFETEVAGLGGDAKFISGKTGASYFYPITKKVIFNTLGEVGSIAGYGDEDVRINERYFLGGRTLRGFEQSGIGPRDVSTDDALGGNAFYRGSTEISFPSGLPDELGIGLHVFSDYGSLWDLDDSGADIVDENSIRVSAGMGVSWQSPLGPIRVDLASPIIDEDFDKDEIFRFDFGTRF
jgi:outer membrane protein insertion porin family